MTNYVKLISKTEIKYAPNEKDGIINYNLDEERMLKDGYKPLIIAEEIETNRMTHIEYEETKNSIIEKFVFDETEEEAETREKRQKRDYLDSLKLSCCDVEHALYQARGIDFDDLKEIIKEKAPSIDIKDLGIELKRGTFDRNNPYINQIGTLLGYSQEDLDYLFENKKLPIIETIKTEEIKEAQEDGI